MINWFKRNIGEDLVSEEEVSKVIYGTDASQLEGQTILVVRPLDARQIHQIVLFAKRERANIVIRGGGSGLVGGAVPQNSIVIDMSNMNKINEITDEYVYVQPGVVLDDLNKVLGKKWFPIQPSSHSVCTIGGMIATNAAGNNAVRYGKMENWVKEVEIIDGNGRFRKAELNDVVGMEGLTGIIIAAKLKIIDKLANTTLSILKFDSLRGVIDKVREIKNTENIISIEFINRKAALLSGLEEGYYLILEYEGIGGESSEYKDEIWRLRENLYPNLASQGYEIIEDPQLKLDNIERFLSWVEYNDVPAFGHIGIGIIHPCFKDRDKIDEMYELVQELNAKVTGEHGIGLSKKKYVNIELKEKIKKLKMKYDEGYVLNRGKII